MKHNTYVILSIGKKIKELRELRNLTQKQLSERLNLSLSSIAMYETSKSQPSLDVLVQLAKFFDVSTDCLLGLEE